MNLLSLIRFVLAATITWYVWSRVRGSQSTGKVYQEYDVESFVSGASDESSSVHLE